jgi:hypothetical protein
VLGGFIQGVNVVDGEFVGGPLDWLTPFSLLVAASLVLAMPCSAPDGSSSRPKANCSSAPAAG